MATIRRKARPASLSRPQILTLVLVLGLLVSLFVFDPEGDDESPGAGLEQQIKSLQSQPNDAASMDLPGPPVENMPDKGLQTQSTAQEKGNKVEAGAAAPATERVAAESVKKQNTDLSIAMVTFTHLNTTARFDNLIFKMFDTWYKDEPEPLYVVLTNQWKEAYRELCSTHSRYCQRIRVLWVDCPEGGFGESPCCKQEKSLAMLPKSYDYVVFCDDDMYFRMEGLRRYLARWDKNQPFIVTAGGQSPKLLGQAGYKNKNERKYECSSEENYRYPWGQPVIYSKAAFDMVLPGFRAGGLVKQCLEFDLTHDAGNSVFHWMYGLKDLAIKFHMFPSVTIKSEKFGVHGIHRFVVSENRSFTMLEVHELIEQKGPVKFRKYMNEFHHHDGYQYTETFAKYGSPVTWGDEWHTMPVQDCLDPEQKKNGSR